MKKHTVDSPHGKFIFTDNELLDEARLEVKLRERVYHRLVQKGTMTNLDAHRKISAMLGIVHILEERAEPGLTGLLEG